VFLKTYKADPGKTYPDMGCSYETFASAEMLEIETLGPLTNLSRGEWIEHVERWTLKKDQIPQYCTDESLDEVLSGWPAW
jgi:hypothetical protein